MVINLKLKIDHVHLKVSDLEKSLKFYQTVLGFKIVRQESKTAYLSLSGDKDSLMFLVVLSELKGNVTSILQHKPRVAGLYHFAILLPGRRFLSHFLKHIQENLIPKYYEGMADHAVSESIYLHDPDFNGIEVYRDRSPSEWKWIDHTVHMVTEPLDVQDLLKESPGVDNQWNGLPPNTTIGHVHLHVSNLAKAKKFYHEILGLNHTATFPGAYFFAANRYHHHIATNTWLGEKISHATNDDKPGLDHYAVHTQKELLLLKNSCIESKVPIDERLVEDYEKYLSSFYAYDFDGIKLQILHNNRKNIMN
jgi:catechol 2,3-dioxygenase